MKTELTFDERLALLAKKHNLQYGWQLLKYGFQRARIEVNSRSEMYAVGKMAENMGDAKVSYWYCTAGGVFDGVVYVMEESDYNELQQAMNAEQIRVNDWWIRYHEADENTRRLMACGKIQ